MASQPLERGRIGPKSHPRHLPLAAVRALCCLGVVALLTASWQPVHTLRGRTFLSVLAATGIFAGLHQRARPRDAHDDPNRPSHRAGQSHDR